jgi:acyl-CoA thioesterase I
MRGYSLRTAYPLARSSQARRRLMLLYNLNAAREELTEPAEDAPTVADRSLPDVVANQRTPWELDEADPDDRTLNAEELRQFYAESSLAVPESLRNEKDFTPTRAFVDEIFHDSETRNEALISGEASESLLDEEEAAEVDESIWSSVLGEDSIISSGRNEESRIVLMDDSREPFAEELPESNGSDDRKPHYPDWYVPNFKTVKRLLDGDKPVTWMFAGESAASAADLAQGRRNFTDHFSERIRGELGRMLDVVINTGSTGETCANLLKNIEWRVLRFHPEVVCILLGRNDAERGAAGREAFQNSLEQIVQIVRDSGAILVLHAPNRVDAGKAVHLTDLPSYVHILRDVAQGYNIPLVDHWDHWDQQKPDAQSLRAWLSADGVQPGVYGQREMAKLMFQRFEIFDPQSPICNARVP